MGDTRFNSSLTSIQYVRVAMSLLSALSCILHKFQPQRLLQPMLSLGCPGTPQKISNVPKAPSCSQKGPLITKGLLFLKYMRQFALFLICSPSIIVQRAEVTFPVRTDHWEARHFQEGSTEVSSLGALPKADAQQVFQMAGAGLVPPVPAPTGFSRGWKAGLQGEASAEEVKM